MGSAQGPLDPSIPVSLASPEAFRDAGAPSAVSVIQTHLSHVFLTHDRVYKLHKGVDLGFVSFATQQQRNADCLRELSLNRRLAPDVYLGIAPIESRDGGWVLGPTLAHPAYLAPGEHCVVMRRLPDGRDALRLLELEQLSREHLERLARTIARFHRAHRLRHAVRDRETGWLAHVVGPVEANFSSLLDRTPGVVPEAEVLALRARTREVWQNVQAAVSKRAREDRAVDGHGDLHLDHVWFESDDAEPIVIDCIAFDDELRRIDAASDIAFLAMDLGSRGRPDLAEHLLARYALASDDFGSYEVVDFFMCYRAAVRAKVAALETLDAGIPAPQREEAENRARHRLDFARRLLAPRDPGRVYLVGGIIGAGKSTVARELARRTGAVVLASDEVRQSMSQPEETVGGWQQGRYSQQATERVYDGLLERAAFVIASGRDVVLDASWASKKRRERARTWAASRSNHAIFIEARCTPGVARTRLEDRRREGRDASEAGPELYDEFARSFQEPDEWPSGDHFIVETDREGWRERLAEVLPGESPALSALR